MNLRLFIVIVVLSLLLEVPDQAVRSTSAAAITPVLAMPSSFAGYKFTVTLLNNSTYLATDLTINYCMFCQPPNDWKLQMKVNGVWEGHRADSVVSVQWTPQ